MDNIFHPGTFLIMSILFAVMAVYLSVKASAAKTYDGQAILIDARNHTVAIGVVFYFTGAIWHGLSLL